MEGNRTDICYARNPWTDDDRSLGRIKDVLFLCESTGHLEQSKKPESLEADVKETSPSIQMITMLRGLQSMRKELNDVNNEIQRRLRDKETHDITHTDILEKRAQMINHINSHLQTVANEKDGLLSHLQQPYVGDFIEMDVHSIKKAAETISQLVPILSTLPSQLENIEWLGKTVFSDGRLEKILSEISSSLADIELKYGNLLKVGNTTKNFYSSQSPNVSYALHDEPF